MSQRVRYLHIGLGSCFLFCSLFFVLSGCGTPPRKKTPVIETKAPVIVEPEVRYEGSLWQSRGPMSDLFMNPKARHVGDIVTVNIIESSSATNKANTDTGRTSSLSGELNGFFGLEQRYPSTHGFINPFSQVSGSMNNSFKGDGTTSRSGDLSAYITARVVEVLPNGNLKILGSREITVNHERQYIHLSGTIRPRDISPDNIVLSTYISDARIEYGGNGAIDDHQRPGWLARIINVIWPF
ncbi:MAG: flagellar basal body L-ring protein FlgH [Desulfatiglans sp.]|jgi:flagellar L-ring protein precursor FlgH|nr:flagellar basal body L-ring protein FlgH [Thermodesulfobacteriota bacterium]MEE4354446.1 flagellar basal body L-ring protein FlgH [Desulfatiglans sp.]